MSATDRRAGAAGAPLSRQALETGRCAPLGPSSALADPDVAAQLTVLPRWALRDGALEARFAFGGYHDTIAFVNALAWMVHDQDHHPDLAVGYDHCTVRWRTHSAGGVTVNDFVCAARTDAVFERR